MYSPFLWFHSLASSSDLCLSVVMWAFWAVFLHLAILHRMLPYFWAPSSLHGRYTCVYINPASGLTPEMLRVHLSSSLKPVTSPPSEVDNHLRNLHVCFYPKEIAEHIKMFLNRSEFHRILRICYLCIQSASTY